MKKLITLSLCLLGVLATTAQQVNADAAGQTIQIPARTAHLENLFEQERYLAENGTAQQIEANRLAIKDGWTAVDPEIGALYKPTNAPKYERLGEGPTPYVASETIERPEPLLPTRDWGDDILIRDDFVDGLDMTATLNTGDLYIGMYENELDFGGTSDKIYIYRSTDDGLTWSLFDTQEAFDPIRKIQLLSLDGTGDQYILAFLMFDNGLFQVGRWDMATAAFTFDSVASDVADFAVDRNFPTDTASMRALATYLKDGFCPTEVFSARSTAGEYGFNWVDEVSVDGVCGDQVDFAYARAGDAFVTYTGGVTGNLYVNSNEVFNDPTAWNPRETLEMGNVRETLNPTVRAARLSIADGEKVVVWASDRADGSTGNFSGVGYLKESGGAFSVFSNFSSGGSNWNIAHTDGWIRREVGVEDIRFTYVRDNIDNSENSVNRHLNFNGANFDTFEPVADTTVDVFDGFPSVVAETADQEPCMAFAGTNSGFGYGLFFDTRAEVLTVAQNTIIGLTYFPNPTSNILNVQASTPLDSVEIYGITGAKVLTMHNNDNANAISVNTSNLASGVYVLKVIAGSQVGTYKVVKQ
ncbi:T9SS type A sorting domain-containing protein [Marinirhabdus gelatinilytica]|uniref:Putative secreted protein (Por secretion system target) n=1 Tax=Marinirhabdus gelatinilytica TaxID=1703343 RepID=A0A370QIX5_9FLAO|nr:T9SS type A sorting domain-containing protein [Marinirhabdus gelatinilytica]RDK88308.1 putative secreted protein (Por secretion system target) [Marinirhabdus gelatinilytica]